MYLQNWAAELQISLDQLLALGRANANDSREPFNMAYLATRGCGKANAVSEQHRRVSQGIFQPLFPRQPRAQGPIEHITNGVHVPSWDSAVADAFWTENCGKGRWIGTLEEVSSGVGGASDAAFWRLRTESRRALVDAVRRRQSIGLADSARLDGVRHSMSLDLDPNALTLGFARRFTAYKRPDLLLDDMARLTRIVTSRASATSRPCGQGASRR